MGSSTKPTAEAKLSKANMLYKGAEVGQWQQYNVQDVPRKGAGSGHDCPAAMAKLKNERKAIKEWNGYPKGKKWGP
jgi:hypothetical protein